MYNLLGVSVDAHIADRNNDSARSSFVEMTTIWADLQPATGPTSNVKAETCNGHVPSQTCESWPTEVTHPVRISQESDSRLSASASG